MRLRLAGFLAILWLCAVVVLAAVAPWIARADPTRPVSAPLESASSGLLLGADALGRDLWSRMLWGGRLSLAASSAAALLAATIGGWMGLVAAMNRGWVDRLILGLANAMLAIPGLLLALLLVAGLGPGFPAVVLAVGIGGAPGFTRLCRTAFLQVLQEGYVTASTALGASKHRVALQHVIPNARGPLLSLVTNQFAWAFLGTTTLAFLGLGGDPSVPEWGSMLDEGRGELLHAPQLALYPGLAISLTLLAVHTLSEQLAQSPFLRRHGLTQAEAPEV